MTKIYLIGGWGEDAEGYGQGMKELAERLRRPWRVVSRLTYKNAKPEIVFPLIADSSARGVIMIGHSFGGDVAVEIANAVPDRIGGVVTVDLTPRRYWTKFTAKEIPVNDRVQCLNIRRSRGVFPLSKKVSGQRAHNIEMPGDHNSVMRAIETHKKIEAQVALWSDTITRTAGSAIAEGEPVEFDPRYPDFVHAARPDATNIAGIAAHNAQNGERVNILIRGNA